MSREKLSIGKKISLLRENAGLTQKNLAEMTGVSQRSISSWEANQTEPKAGDLKKLAITLACSTDELLGIASTKQKHKQIESHCDYQLIDVYDAIQAGPNGRFPANDPLYRVPRLHGVTRRDLLGFEVAGDSMEPRYKPGDVVLVAPDITPKTGEDVVVIVDGGTDEYFVMLKKWSQNNPSQAQLISINKEYPPYSLDRSSVKHIYRVVGHLWASHVQACRVEIEAKPEQNNATTGGGGGGGGVRAYAMPAEDGSTMRLHEDQRKYLKRKPE